MTAYSHLQDSANDCASPLDESTLPGNEVVLLAYMRFIKQERLVQELLFAKELLTDTKEHFRSFYRWSTVHAGALRSTSAALSRKTPKRPLEQFTLEGQIDLQSSEEVKLRMERGYEYSWLQEEIPVRYPALWAAIKSLLIAIPSSSAAERGLSVVTDLVT
ncbi:hypothetical protein M514_26283 [Trichuris suis]|uniref:Uncharacterized protein n=1 Tax=Trichuris suis TaxID=68888 RepID=A0A085MWD8_9BILA|nr:hypothetical protein M514_26283 [Trichuris suis]